MPESAASDYAINRALGVNTTGAANTTGTIDINDLIDPNLYPTTTSSSTSTSGSSNSSRSSNFAGLDPATRSAILGAVMPGFEQSVSGLPSAIDDYTQNAVNLYRNMATDLYRTQVPATLEELAAQGLSVGSIGENRVNTLLQGITGQTADKAYEAGMTAAQMKYDLPTILGNLINLTNYSEGSSRSSGSSSSQSNSSSYSSDPGAPQRDLLNFLSGTTTVSL